MSQINIKGIKLLVIALLGLPPFLFAQSSTPESALKQFARYPNERIFVQFDKDEYLAGETVHYKAWVFVKSSLSYISTNLYVDWMDATKKPVSSSAIPLVGGVCEGSFAIPADLPENMYYFHAYTGWMLNFDESQHYLQPLIIYNPASKMRLNAPAANYTASLQPESGMLLDAVESDVSVRLQSVFPLHGSWSGFLYEDGDSSNHITEFQSMNDEVGLFTITPYAGKKYSVKISRADGSSLVVPLPAVQQKGAVIKIAGDDLGISFRISSKGLANQLKGYKILVHKQGELLYSATIQNPKEEINGIIPADSSTRGLLHISLFDAAGNAVAERLYFAGLQHFGYQSPVINYGKISGEAKTANEWMMQVDTVRSGSYAVLVDDDHDAALAGTHSILSTYWLNGIGAAPQHADWYFRPGNKAAASALDAWLLGEKWSLFNWNDLLRKPAATMSYFPDNYITYTGFVTQKSKPVMNEKITVLFQLKDSSRILTEVKTDSAGLFRLKSLYYFDTAKVFYHITNNKNAPVKIDVDFKRIDHFSIYNGVLSPTGFTLVQRNKTDSIPQRVKDYAAALKHVQTIADGFKTMDAVVVKANIRSKTEALDRRLSSPMFRSPGEMVIDFINEEQDLGGSTILEWLGGRVAGVMPDGSGGVTIRGQRPAVYIDEFLDDGDPSRLSGIPYTEIAMVKVIRNSYLIGASGTPVIAVYTKRPDMYPASDFNRPQVTAKRLPGYIAADIFKPLSYGKSMTSRTGYDSRSLLYWNDNITPENGESTIRFYNNDISKKLRLLVIGFTARGGLVYLEKTIELK
ncbi:MAG: hypothetical protein U0V75_04640 [Ferruginibacter sp.]